MIANVHDNDNDVHDKHFGPDCDQFCRWFELLAPHRLSIFYYSGPDY